VAQVKEAAGVKRVYVIGGVSIDQQLLDAGLADELKPLSVLAIAVASCSAVSQACGWRSASPAIRVRERVRLWLLYSKGIKAVFNILGRCWGASTSTTCGR